MFFGLPTEQNGAEFNPGVVAAIFNFKIIAKLNFELILILFPLYEELL